jgi:IS30 family transposase
MPSLDLAPLAGRYLSIQEREEIAVGLAAKESLRSIARRLGRSPSTISREIQRNCPRNNAGRYLARHPVSGVGRAVAGGCAGTPA